MKQIFGIKNYELRVLQMYVDRIANTTFVTGDRRKRGKD